MVKESKIWVMLWKKTLKFVPKFILDLGTVQFSICLYSQLMRIVFFFIFRFFWGHSLLEEFIYKNLVLCTKFFLSHFIVRYWNSYFIEYPGRWRLCKASLMNLKIGFGYKFPVPFGVSVHFLINYFLKWIFWSPESFGRIFKNYLHPAI